MALAHVYRYQHPSVLSERRLSLATSGGVEEFPRFFQGRFLRAYPAARMLRSLMDVVRSRFHIPPAMLARILAEADPVITCSEQRLRFEAFSACCGVYARVDFLPAAVEGERLGRGTTNVDFNAPLLSALAGIREGDSLQLGVGESGVEVVARGEALVEKRVELPLRWVKGFLEAQRYQAEMRPAFVVSAAEARRFFSRLPRANSGPRPHFVTLSGKALRLSAVAGSSSVAVHGLERLRLLEPLFASARRLQVYHHAASGASAWVLELDDAFFHLVLSPEVWRGFSGEGQALESLLPNERRNQRVVRPARAHFPTGLYRKTCDP